MKSTYVLFFVLSIQVGYARGLIMQDVAVHYPVNEARPALYFDDTKAIKLKNILLNGHYLDLQPALLAQKNSEVVEVMH